MIFKIISTLGYIGIRGGYTMGNCVTPERPPPVYNHQSEEFQKQVEKTDLSGIIGKAIFEGASQANIMKLLYKTKTFDETTFCSAEFLLYMIYNYRREYPHVVTLLSNKDQFFLFQETGTFCGFWRDNAREFGIPYTVI